MNSWKVRVNSELVELQDKYQRLSVFMHSPDVTSLSPMQRNLLMNQKLIMATYIVLLKERLTCE